ncbi:oligosaccharide flippase family protein [Halosquirtibacter xylanolyticus]|uniref:lipopolysaccharide biosynthesis protein n=1 Tax=Halosquirtibacter xylanolyticus TaxID=3374599 RepID=UPI003749D5F8|nr:oligosaccharide flippase family protein [Prolixibacteraceae bacterium]
MSTIKKLAGQTVIYGLSSILPRFLNYFLALFYTRIFLPESLGEITNMFAWVAILMALLTYGMETAFFRYASQKGQDIVSVFTTSFLTMVVSSMVFLSLTFLFNTPLADFFGYHNADKYVRWLSYILVLDAVSTIPFAKLRLEGRPVKFMIIKLLNVSINIGFNLFFLVLCPWLTKESPDSVLLHIYDPNISVGYVLISNVIASLFSLILLIPEMHISIRKYDPRLLKQLLIYGIPILVVSVAGMVNQNIDKVLIPKLIKPHTDAMYQLGIYGANAKLAVIMTLFVQAFRYAFEPFFFARQKETEDKKIYADILTYFVIFCLAVFLGITLFIDQIKMILDPKYYEGLGVVPYILIANMLVGIYYNLSLWYKLTDKTYFGAYFSIGGALITISINSLFLSTYGYKVAAIAQVVCFAVMTVASYYYMRKYYPIDYNVKRVILLVIFALSLYFSGQYLPDVNTILGFVLRGFTILVFLVLSLLPELKVELEKRSRG